MNVIALEETIEALLENTKEEIMLMVGEAVEGTHPGVAYFPIEWNFGDDPSDGDFGEPVEDPFVIRVTPEDIDASGPKYEFNLRDVVQGFVDGVVIEDVIDEDFVEMSTKLRDAFLELATMIDEKLPVSV
jgi:hypothetical protein